MKIKDLPINDIKVGMRIKSMISNRLGTIVKREDSPFDIYCWILWDGDEKPFSGFFYNFCDCELV